MTLAHPYSHNYWNGENDFSIQLDLPFECFRAFPSAVELENELLLLKDEFHITLIHPPKSLAQTTESFFENFITRHSILLQALLSDFRFAVHDDRKTILLRCEVTNLEELFSAMGKKIGLTLPLQPTHITLYKLQNRPGIAVDSNEIIEQFCRIQRDDLNAALRACAAELKVPVH